MELIGSFFNRHFDVIFAINVMVLLVLAASLIFSQVCQICLEQGWRRILNFLLLASSLTMLGLTVYIYTQVPDQRQPFAFVRGLNPGHKPGDLFDQISTNTDWVAEDVEIVFIDGNNLMSIQANGKNRQPIFTANEKIKEYHFSPDGHYILIVTETGLFQYDRPAKTAKLIAQLELQEPEQNWQGGAINGVRWDGQSQKYCFRMAKWNSYDFKDIWLIYDVKTQSWRPFDPGMNKFTSLIWDQAGQNLYSTKSEAKDLSQYANSFQIYVYKIPLDTLQPVRVASILSNERDLSDEHFRLHGINLFDSVEKYSFGPFHKKQFSWESSSGAVIGIDSEDYLYYLRNWWWRTRLFKISRAPAPENRLRYQYQGGELTVQNLRWLPSGKYVIMEHNLYGLLILEPKSGKVGILDNQKGNTFGWYSQKGAL